MARVRAKFVLRANQKIITAATPRTRPRAAPRNPTTASGAAKFMLLAKAAGTVETPPMIAGGGWLAYGYISSPIQ